MVTFDKKGVDVADYTISLVTGKKEHVVVVQYKHICILTELRQSNK